MHEVRLSSRPLDDLRRAVPDERIDALIETGSSLLGDADRAIININSTAVGGGVAEMLRWALPYVRGTCIDARWFVMDGDAEFFAITKRLHCRLHGVRGDDGDLGASEAEHLRRTGSANAGELAASVAAGDVLVVHDPQPLALLPSCADWDTPVVWRCHIGTELTNEHTTEAWEFLRPLLLPYVDRYVFTRAAYAPAWIPPDRVTVIAPSIDPLSPKNEHLTADHAVDALRHVGIVAGSHRSAVRYQRADGSPGRLQRYADIIRTGPAPHADDPLVVQISRWDPLKDMPGVMRSFVDHVLDGSPAHLVLAGPVVTSVADDPTAADELERTWTLWRQLPHHARSRVQLVCLPMADQDENAFIVNALQRHATVITQKSLEEGFGLTVTEAMYKQRAVVASRVGGLAHQLTDGIDGRLVDDPRDLATFGSVVADLLVDDALRTRLGDQARRTVAADHLPDTAFTRWAAAIECAVDAHVGARRRPTR